MVLTKVDGVKTIQRYGNARLERYSWRMAWPFLLKCGIGKDQNTLPLDKIDQKMVNMELPVMVTDQCENLITLLIRLILLLRLTFESWILFGLQCRPITTMPMLASVICRLSHCSIQYCKIIDVAKNLSVAWIHFCINWVAFW